MLSPAISPRINRHAWRLVIIVALTLLAILHVTGALPSRTLDRLDGWLYDLRLAVNLPSRREAPDDRIVIVQVDERSLDALGQWPWRRDVMARLVDELHDRQRAAAIGIDAVFAESQPGPGRPARPASAADTPDGRLAAALARSGAVIGYYFTSDRHGHRSGQLPAPVAPLSRPAPNGLLQWDGYGADLPILMQAGARAGFFNAVQDTDGQVRAAPLIAAFDGGIYESLSLAVLRQALAERGQQPAVRLRVAEGQVTGLDLFGVSGRYRRLSVPLDAHGVARVPFRGPGGEAGRSFSYVSAVDVVQGRLPSRSLAGRIVLIGCTAPGLMDLRSTPVGEAYPGVEMHASLIAGMLDGRVPALPAWTPVAEVLLIAAIGTAMATALLMLRLTGRLVVGAVIFAALVGVNEGLYRVLHLALPMVTALSLVLAIGVSSAMLGYWQETRAKRRLVQQFAAYVPPELVLQMQAAPGHYTMRAQAVEVTVLFCDLRGFTGLAEGMDPLAVQALLGEVFSRLTQVIQAHRGTIDKYMGDCVMAFWGAPVPAPDHAARAIRAALAMQQALAQLAREQAQAGRAEAAILAAGIGVNTGTVAVGDMGSSVRRTYTVIGDAVNLAARLERLTQVYGVDLIAGETTQAQAPGWVWQELDCVRVKGRHQATSIYTPRAPADQYTLALGTELALWQEALDDWRAQRLAECAEKIRRLRTLSPAFGPYRVYAKRLDDLESPPPPPPGDSSLTPLSMPDGTMVFGRR